jgi:CRISPR/Cas system-associated exonuclease Cas4 (RecB family)
MLKEIIDKYYLDREKDKDKKRTQRQFYISQAGKCSRQIFFKFKNVPEKELEPHVLRLFDHGDHMHQLIMSALTSTRDIHLVASEIKIPPQELVSGRADAIVSDGKDLYVLDIKSMNSMIFKTLTEPKEENIKQIQLYLYYFKIPKGILLYVNKDNLELKEFIIDYNPIEAEELVENLNFLKKQIDSNTIPSRIPDYPEDWQCRYCQFREVCDLGDSDEMKWEDFKTKIQGINSSEA